MKKVLVLLLSLVMCFGIFVGCGGGDDASVTDPSTITIWYVGGNEEALRCKQLKEAFEAENPDIELKFTNGGGYDSILNSLSFGQNVADLIYVDDEYFKRMVDGNFIVGLDSYLADSTIDVDDLWTEAVGRYRYNKNYNTSNDSDPLYAIPKNVNPTTMFVNVGAMRDAGITVISVDEADLFDFYKGSKADNYGNTIDDYINGKGTSIKANSALKDVKGEHSGSILNLVKKGYYEADDVKVFNVRVACNWDEIEACAKVMTTKYNAKSPTTYGYQTEWWFYYGWSVGGDCIGDQSGTGQFVFTLDDANPNYKVIEDVTINGTEYKASGDVNMTFVSYKDKLYLASNSSEVTSLVSAGKLQEFPSTKDAFTRFCMLSRSGTDSDGNTGVAVAPMPSTGTTSYSDALQQFNLGNKLAMFVGYADAAYSISTNVDWDFAAMPIYKSYNTADNSVEKIGTAASQSKSTAYAMTTQCVERGKKDNAIKVLEFFCGNKGQEILAKDAYAIPNSATAANTYYLPEAKTAFGSTKNIQTIIDASETQLPGDWWYMQERAWIANWSQSLNANNNSVRNNGLTLTEYFNSVKTLTNNALKRLWKTQAN